MLNVYRSRTMPCVDEYVWYDPSNPNKGSKKIIEEGDYELIGRAESEEGAWGMSVADMEGREDDASKVRTSR